METPTVDTGGKLLFFLSILFLCCACGLYYYAHTTPLANSDAADMTPLERSLDTAAIAAGYDYLALTDRRPTSTTESSSSSQPTARRTNSLRTVTAGELEHYIEVTDACPHNFDGECLNVRSQPTTTAPVVHRLRTGVVLKVRDVITDESGNKWYKIAFDEWLRYPERVNGHWYVAAAYVRDVYDQGVLTKTEQTPPTNKKIVVDRSNQTLTAYDGDTIFLNLSISTGLELTPTPRGTFTIFKKTPTRYMQGPLPYMSVQKYYDLPGVPWNLYFTESGAVIHGAYWHENFGSQYSHGCVNVDLTDAKTLYDWADVGTTVIVQD